MLWINYASIVLLSCHFCGGNRSFAKTGSGHAEGTLKQGAFFLEAGHDKHWADNLILFPDHWAGDPCVQIWGGPEHHFVGNEVRLLLLKAPAEQAPAFVPHTFPIKYNKRRFAKTGSGQATGYSNK
jgi:hypothetical protein